MNVLVSGASGLIGAAVIAALQADGSHVSRLQRTSIATDGPTWDPLAGRIELANRGPWDAVIHLAGETIAQRWSPAAKERIRRSRVEGTQLLTRALAALPCPPRVLVCASATGIYGDRGDAWLDEHSTLGGGFLAEVTRAWEAASAPAEAAGIRVVRLRLGIVLARHGGALAKMLPAFRFGFGGQLGDGQHYWSWIALGDAVDAVRHSIECESLRGPVNVVSPHPVTNAGFTRTLGLVLRRPTVFTVPRFAVQLLFGEMGRAALLSSFRVRPGRLLETGFAFQHPMLDQALTASIRAG